MARDLGSAYVEGMEQGRKSGEQNPFTSLLREVNDSIARRTKEDQDRRKEERQLSNLFLELGKKHEYDKELQKQKAEEETKGLIPKGLAEGKIEETTEEGKGVFEGTPFGAVGKRYKAIKTETPVYLVDPTTGGMKQTGTIPKGAKVVSQPVPTTERVQMGTALDSMDDSITAMEERLKDPNIMLRALNPFAEREFKAVLSSFDKEAAIAAGGKQLTQTELNLIRQTRPTLLDAKTPGAISYKISKLRGIVKNAKSRLGAAGGKSQTAGQGNKVVMKSPDGKSYEIDASEAEEALKHGWTR